jgi:tetratricopeptide (TPR) repeat protein
MPLGWQHNDQADRGAARFLMGIWKVQTGQYDEAQTYFETLRPNLRAALGYMRLGIVHYQHGDLVLAARAWARMSPRPNALLELLTELRVQERRAEALAVSEAVLAVSPNDTEAIRAYAPAVYATDHNLAKAVAALQHWIDLQPASADPYLLLADLYMQEGEFEQAAAWIEKAKPLSRSAYITQAMLYRRMGQLELAQQTLAELLVLEPDSLQAISYMGQILDEEGRLDMALPYYRRAAAMTKPSLYTVAIYSSLGSAEERAGNTEAAIEAYQKALQANPDDDRVVAALRSLGSR